MVPAAVAVDSVVLVDPAEKVALVGLLVDTAVAQTTSVINRRRAPIS